MSDRLRETAGHDRELEVRDLIIGARAKHVAVDPEFWCFFEEQLGLEPFPTLLRELAK